jgi:hypothetical protein
MAMAPDVNGKEPYLHFEGLQNVNGFCPSSKTKIHFERPTKCKTPIVVETRDLRSETDAFGTSAFCGTFQKDA